MFINQSPYSFTEFYEGMQNLQDSPGHYDNFGKATEFTKTTKAPRKITSVQSISLAQGAKCSIKKSSSSAAFHENDFDSVFYGKCVPNIPCYQFHEESTKESYSPFSSVTSLSSVTSMPTSTQNGSKIIKQQGKKKIPTEQDFRNKYKTEVCRYWAETGYCEFGDQCAFAHGENEIRQKAFVASNYKTKHCVAYYETGYCVYGVRCQFLHCFRKDCCLNPKLMWNTYAEDLENIEIWITEEQDCQCLRRKNRPRLSVFERLAQTE